MRSSSFREPGRSGGPAPLAWMLGALLAASFTPARGDVHGDALRRALQYAEKHHYANIRVDDRISQATLDNYLTALDGQRLYFTREDAQRLRAQYGDRLDDAMRAGQADPALEIFSLYQERRQRFLALSGDFLKTRPNLNTAREWVPDRSNAPRPANQAEMEAMWRDKLRFELIGLMLGNRTRQAASALLIHRYRYGDFGQFTLGAERSAWFPMGGANGAGLGITPDSDAAFTRFLDSFARALDANSSYSSIDAAAANLERLIMDSVDIPLLLADRGGHVVVDRNQPERLSEISKLKEGDRIAAVRPHRNGEAVEVAGWRAADVHKLLPGPAGAPVVFHVFQDVGAISTVERAMERAPAMSAWEKGIFRLASGRFIKRMLRSPRMGAGMTILEAHEKGLPRSVGAIAAPSFYDKFSKDAKGWLKELRSGGIDALVVDLRGNNSDLIGEAVSFAVQFLGSKPVAQQRRRDGKVALRSSKRQEKVWSGALAVLVNRHSGSAAEVFAAAIQDYGRGVVVGALTSGNGAYRTEYKIKAPFAGRAVNGELRITTGDLRRIGGGRLQDRGVMPDLSLPAADDEGRLMDIAVFAGMLSSHMAAPALGPAIEPPQTRREAPGVESLHPDAARLPLETLAARHQRRVSGNAGWRLISGRAKLARKFSGRAASPLNLDERRAIQAAQSAEEVALARKWLKAQGTAARVDDSALKAALLSQKESLLPAQWPSAEEEPALLRALALARGLVFVPDENSGYRMEDYDLAMRQAAMIAADLAELP